MRAYHVTVIYLMRKRLEMYIYISNDLSKSIVRKYYNILNESEVKAYYLSSHNKDQNYEQFVNIKK